MFLNKMSVAIILNRYIETLQHCFVLLLRVTAPKLVLKHEKC